MMRFDLGYRLLHTPFRQSFRHAAAERSSAASCWVEAGDGTHTGFGEGCPREYVTGESLNSTSAFHAKYADMIASLTDLDKLRSWMMANRSLIDDAPAAWCAHELALLDLLARRESIPVERLLDLPDIAGEYRYTAVLGDASDTVFAKQLQQYTSLGFRQFKLKVSGKAELDAERIEAIRRIEGSSLRLDANNLWHDLPALQSWQGIVNLDSVAVEEPLATPHFDMLRRAGDMLGTPIILDEHCLRVEHLSPLFHDPQRWIINIRISKMGGLLRALELMQVAQSHGLRVIIGAQVGETSVLTRAALPVAKAAGSSLAGQEGAYGEYLLEHDIVAPVLQFGERGMLSADAIASRPGWGLSRVQEVAD